MASLKSNIKISFKDFINIDELQIEGSDLQIGSLELLLPIRPIIRASLNDTAFRAELRNSLSDNVWRSFEMVSPPELPNCRCTRERGEIIAVKKVLCLPDDED